MKKNTIFFIKFLAILKIQIKDRLYYKFNLLMDIIFPIFNIYLYFVIWDAIFRVKDKELSISFPMTITYYIIISFFSRLDTSEQTALKISEEIKNGVFSRYLLLPMGVKSYYFSLCISNMMVNFFLCIPALLVWILIFAKYFLLPEHFYNIVVFSPLLLLGLIWLMQSNLSIMLISFWLEEVYAFFHIKRVLFSFLLGEIIPILLFPLEFQNILKHLPFYYIYNISIEIYFGNRSVNLNDYVIIIIWNIFFYLLNSHIYRLAIKKYSGVGI